MGPGTKEAATLAHVGRGCFQVWRSVAGASILAAEEGFALLCSAERGALRRKNSKADTTPSRSSTNNHSTGGKD